MALYGASFKFNYLFGWFVFFAAAAVFSWLLYGACPLTVWENKLRERANIPKRRLFGLTEMLDQKLKKTFGIGLPKGSTFFLYIFMILIWVWAV
jgi:hypothetical protein